MSTVQNATNEFIRRDSDGIFRLERIQVFECLGNVVLKACP